MTGRKTLREVRKELEAALGAGPAGDGEVAECLRRFLAASSEAQSEPDQAPGKTGKGKQRPTPSRRTDAPR